MRRFLVLLAMLLASVRADAALLVPEAGQSLGSGGHLKMHQVIVVDGEAPDQSLVVGEDGTVAVGGLSLDGETLMVSAAALNALDDAIAIEAAAPDASLSVTAAGGLSVQEVIEAAGLSVSGAIEAVPGSGGTMTLYEADATRRNRLVAGADALGAYLRSTYATGGLAELRLILGANTEYTFSPGTPVAAASDVVTVGNLDEAIGYQADMWRLTSSQYGSQAPLQGFSRVTDAGFVPVGDGVTIANGVATFPSTGVWRVTAQLNFRTPSAGDNWVSALDVTRNNSTWTTVADPTVTAVADNDYVNISIEYLFNVTDVSLCKSRLRIADFSGDNSVVGSSSANVTYLIFERVAPAQFE